MSIFYPINLVSSLLTSILRFGAGWARDEAPAQAQLPILYEFEGCPFCRIAREAVSETGASVLVRPCPKAGKRFRPQVTALGGKGQFPYLIDPNTDIAMYESADIARYLHETYGGSRSPLRFLGPFNGVLSQFSAMARLMAGTFVTRSRAPEKPLEFSGAERDPRARLVKERLCSMQLEYLWHPRGSTPTLVDPNTGVQTQGAGPIRRYLKETYCA